MFVESVSRRLRPSGTFYCWSTQGGGTGISNPSFDTLRLLSSWRVGHEGCDEERILSGLRTQFVFVVKEGLVTLRPSRRRRGPRSVNQSPLLERLYFIEGTEEKTRGFS